MNEPPPEYDQLLKPAPEPQIRPNQPTVHYHAAPQPQQPIILNQVPHAPQPVPVNVILNTGGNLNGNGVTD
uniref:Uncharacterized protein n=1 Tax=Panagrolaimus sp. JU765 TaxID=591449 RepID=A0AC34RAB7_9BILA